MPAKKVNQGASAGKPSKRKAAPVKRMAPPHKPSKKRTLTPDEIPEYDRNVTSQASRDRKRFKLSRASIYQDVDSIETITNLAQKLQGESVYSWGVPEVDPIEASRKKKTKSRGSKKIDAEDNYLQMFEDMRLKRAPIILNSPERSPILRIPLEIREKIYSYLLIYPRPIKVKPDWTIVERNPFQSHSVVKVCKQFAEEASCFVYKSNIFQAVLRNPTTIFRRREDPIEINPKFHPLFRNIVIDCSIHCWNLEWQEKVVAGLQKLVEAKSVIQFFTLVLAPKRVSMSTTALGIEYNPVTFADFLWYEGPLMAAIRNLGPKVMNVVVKKGTNKRILISIDMTYHQAGSDLTLLSNAETIKLAQAKAGMVEEELLSLKQRYEEIFEDDECAMQEGKCRLLCGGERVPRGGIDSGAGSSTSSPKSRESVLRAFSEGRSVSPTGRESTTEPI